MFIINLFALLPSPIIINGKWSDIRRHALLHPKATPTHFVILIPVTTSGVQKKILGSEPTSSCERGKRDLTFVLGGGSCSHGNLLRLYPSAPLPAIHVPGPQFYIGTTVLFVISVTVKGHRPGSTGLTKTTSDAWQKYSSWNFLSWCDNKSSYLLEIIFTTCTHFVS